MLKTVVAAVLLLFALQTAPTGYTVVTVEGRRPLPVRNVNNVDMVALSQVAAIVGMTLREDSLAHGMSVITRGQTILLTAGQPIASVGGRVLTLSAPVVKDAQGWFVPLDFLSRAVAPATSQRIEVRASIHVILIGNVEVPASGLPPEEPAPAAPPAPVPLGGRPALRAIAIDAGHGGDDPGARAGDGAAEKDIALAIAQRLRAAIDARLGLRVIMTREGDDAIPLGRRTAVVNNGQADVLISIHADAAWRPTVRGAQVLTLDPDNYTRRLPAQDTPSVTVPLVGGGTRVIDVVPWNLAQLPHLDGSVAFANNVAQRLREHNVPMNTRAQDSAPLRLLAGANMPAILLECGFLSNTDDAAALAGNDLPGAIVESLMAALADLRDEIARGGGR